jgi:hypothetical protein
MAMDTKQNLTSSSFTKTKKLYTIKELGNTKRKREKFSNEKQTKGRKRK